MADQNTPEQARKNVQDAVAITLTAMGEEMFPYLAAMDLDSRAEAVEAIYQNGQMPPEVALALLVDPLAVGEQVMSDPLLAMLMLVLQEVSLAMLTPELLEAAEKDAQILDNAKTV